MKIRTQTLKVSVAALATLAALFLTLLLTIWRPYLRQYGETRQYASIAAAQAAVTRDPNDAKAHFTLATAAIKAGDKAAAIESFKKAVAAAPDNEVYRLVYAPLLLRDNPGEARRLVTPVLTSASPNLVAEARAILRHLPAASTPAAVGTP